MLHGHADIYLRDATTGKIVDERHDDNLVTTAAQDAISMNPYAMRSNLNDGFGMIPVVPNLIGGVLLFPNTVPESTSDYFARNQWPTGYCSNNADSTDDPRRGSYNATESYATSGGYRLVFDFGTADANGDISCICLTNRNGGMSFQDSRFTKGRAITNVCRNSMTFHLGDNSDNITPNAFHDGAFYKEYFTDDTSGQGSTKLTLRKWSSPPLAQPLARSYSLSKYEDVSIDLSQTHAKPSANWDWDYHGAQNRHYYYQYFRKYKWTDDGLVIFMSDNRNNVSLTPSGTWYVIKVSWDGTVQEKSFSYADMSGVDLARQIILTPKWIYVPWQKKDTSGDYSRGFYAVDFDDTQNMNSITSGLDDYKSYRWAGNYEAYNVALGVPYGSMGLYSDENSTSYDWGFALADGQMVAEDIGRCCVPNRSADSYWNSSYAWMAGHVGPFCFVRNDESISVYLDNTALMTIDNLSSPITKTADRTLKVVYTLTEE
jgi:hypothetical protein